jgi:hypothetical protein
LDNSYIIIIVYTIKNSKVTKEQAISILESDLVIYTAALHWNVARSAYNNQAPKVIYVEEFIHRLANKIYSAFDSTIITEKSLLHLAHWYTEAMIREEYAQLVNKS